MTGTIVMLDTTVLTADSLCRGDAWRVLAHVAPKWGIRVAVTEVVVAEAVANYQREVHDVRDALQGFAQKKRFAALGLNEAYDAAGDVISAAIQNYADQLRKNLSAAGVEVLPVAAVSHMDVVQRATARRRPCNDKGDGYRDSLNWLTVLELAKNDAQVRIIWVSDNTDDFGDGESDSGFHADLIVDLESISAQERVSWHRTLAGVVLALVAERTPGDESDIKQVQKRVRNDSVLDYLEKELLPTAAQQAVNPRRCGLPVETVTAKFRGLSGIRNLDLDVKGVVSEDGAVAEFVVEVDAGIDVTLALPSPDSEPGIVTSTRYINKPLQLRGLVTLGRFEKPIGAELSVIESHSDDSSRNDWDNNRKTASQVSAEMIHRMMEAIRPFYQNQVLNYHEAAAARWIQQNQDLIRQASEAMGERMRLIDQSLILQATDAIKPLLDQQKMIEEIAEAVKPLRDNQEILSQMADSAGYLPATRADDEEEPDSKDDNMGE